jgi:hypothetical protein
MSEAFLGGLAGMVLGLIGFAACRLAARHVERNPQIRNREQLASILQMAGLAVLVTDTLVGYFAFGPVLADILRGGETI